VKFSVLRFQGRAISSGSSVVSGIVDDQQSRATLPTRADMLDNIIAPGKAPLAKG